MAGRRRGSNWGGALDALDRLLRLLRVLAVYQRRLGELRPRRSGGSACCRCWTHCCPPRPARPTASALERLRKLLNQFADDAAGWFRRRRAAGEVVRSHFAGVLGEADTRAPLLTGGISFGRMVPMRLLPFRVICVLGLNDGDSPMTR